MARKGFWDMVIFLVTNGSPDPPPPVCDICHKKVGFFLGFPNSPSETKTEIKHFKKNGDNLGKTKDTRQVCCSSCHSWAWTPTFWIKVFFVCFSWNFQNLFVWDHYVCFPFWFITFGRTKSFYISKFGTIGIMQSDEYRPSM